MEEDGSLAVQRHHSTPGTQGRDEPSRRPILSKVQRSATHNFKTPKPSLEIYRPPKTGQQHRPSTSPRVHFEAPPPIKMATTSNPKTAPLKRSKSFTGPEVMELSAFIGFDVGQFPPTYQKLITKALTDPSSLEVPQILEVVKALCNKAIETLPYSQPVARLCFSIIEKDERQLFLECLVNACREWFLEKDKLLREVTGWSRRFTAYVSFVMELYLSLKTHSKNSFISSMYTADHITILLHLLFECCLLMLSPSSMRNLAEIECLKTVLLSAGRHMESDCQERMARLMEAVRLGCCLPSSDHQGASPQARKVLLELVELHASQWQFTARQAMYYYPYTSK